MNNDNRWKTYFENTKDSKPRRLLVEAIGHVKEKNEALDLGSGALNDVRYLVSLGFKHITAVDHEPIAKDIIKHFPSDIVNYVISTFEDFEFTKEKYDLVNAQFALPFSPQDTFEKLFDSIIFSLKPGGVFTGQFFGIRDEWNTGDKNRNFHTKEDAEKLLSKLKVVAFKEEENDKPTASGVMKHWHIFHFIAIK